MSVLVRRAARARYNHEAPTPGTRLGPYEVTGSLGVGGMGEVYRGRDTKLNREVALKVLPASVADDPDRFARFRREAHVLATLNHRRWRSHGRSPTLSTPRTPLVSSIAT